MRSVLHFLWLRRRSLAVFFSGLFCLLVVCHYCWVTIGPDSGVWGPRFVCEELEYNCGEVPGKEKVEHDFVISNSGWQALHVKAVASCASCCALKLSNEEIARGESATLNVVFDSSKVEKGPFKKQVLVKTDDPYSPDVVFLIQGTTL